MRHIRIDRSTPAASTWDPSGVNATAESSPVDSESVVVRRPVAQSHSLTVRSAAHEAKVLPSGAKARP